MIIEKNCQGKIGQNRNVNIKLQKVKQKNWIPT